MPNDLIKKQLLLQCFEVLKPDVSDYAESICDDEQDPFSSPYWAAWDMWCDCKSLIESAVPVNTPVGVWLCDEESDYMKASCSACGTQFRVCDLNAVGDDYLKPPKYCPHCGAIMDEREDNDSE